ncbi:YchJ family protein [Aliikangiella sp. G2MR2-5]|uniref:YchJ family protein n=1 Tax=Aliikangiella sp. G2MR2-5 TaxID=2788943 RepID=UPI0018AA81A3|nr:YchJ family protein [Aliikangiella sp. G2MR2-5]
MSNTCHCCSGKEFTACCEPFLTKQKQPETAEQLMRSRYTAFKLGSINYLIDTLAPEKRKSDDKEKLTQVIEGTQWLGLKVVTTEKGKKRDIEGVVEFVAFYQDGSFEQLHEHSKFIKHDSKWFYLEGEFLPAIKIGRNDPCFCGSEKKYKKCHG